MLWQHLTTMVIGKIRKMSVKGTKLKSESFFSISPGVLELWRKTLGGGGGAESGPDRLKATSHLTIFDIPMRLVREDQRHRLRFIR